MQSRPLLSIIIPAYNEEYRLPQSLRKIDEFLKQQSYEAELLVVENGSQDGTTAVAEAFAAGHDYVRVLHSDRGKGAAVKKGMLEASGQYRFMCDADLSMPIEEVNKFLPPVTNSYQLAMASREAPGAKRYNEPEYRHIMGRVFNLIVRVLAVPKLHDTQCGFKCFTAEAAEQVFVRQTMNGWGFDVEVAAIALALGYKVVEIPINWYFNDDSRVSPVKDTIRMFREVLQVRRNLRAGMYH